MSRHKAGPLVELSAAAFPYLGSVRRLAPPTVSRIGYPQILAQMRTNLNLRWRAPLLVQADEHIDVDRTRRGKLALMLNPSVHLRSAFESSITS